MAPPTGLHRTTQNGSRKLVQPVVPALPILPKNKNKNRNKNIQSLEQRDNGNGVVPPNAQSYGKTVKTDEQSHLKRSVQNAVTVLEDAGSQLDSATTSLVIPDESNSVDSMHSFLVSQRNLMRETGSQGHATISEVESSITTTVTDSSADTPVSEPNTGLPPSSHETLKHFDITTIETSSVVNGQHSFTPSPEDQLPEAVNISPELAPITMAISPVSNGSAEKEAIEISTRTTPNASITNIPIISPEVVQPSQFSQQLNGRNQDPEVVVDRYGPPLRESNPNSHRTSISQINVPPPILDHLLHLASSKQMADWIIQVDQLSGNPRSFIVYAHGCLLLRSEHISKLMTRPQDPAFNSRVIRILMPRPIQPHAFEAALRFVYSDTVLSAEALFPPDTYMDKHARAHVVDYLLSYWVAGLELGLEPVSNRAYGLLAGIIDWDVAVLLIWEMNSLRLLSPVKGSPTLADPHVLSDSILWLVAGLFVNRLDLGQFSLDFESQPTFMVSRLAQFELGRAASNPALAGMVFGSMPSTAHMSPAPPSLETSLSTESIASSILLNAEYPDLSILVKEMLRNHGIQAVPVVSDVIQEREKRRLQIFNDESLSNKERTANPTMWDVIGWREVFEEGKLHRERVGFVLPSKKTKHRHISNDG